MAVDVRPVHAGTVVRKTSSSQVVETSIELPLAGVLALISTVLVVGSMYLTFGVARAVSRSPGV